MVLNYTHSELGACEKFLKISLLTFSCTCDDSIQSFSHIALDPVVRYGL